MIGWMEDACSAQVAHIASKPAWLWAIAVTTMMITKKKEKIMMMTMMMDDHVRGAMDALRMPSG